MTIMNKSSLDKSSSTRSIYLLIMGALVLWGGLLAVGAFLGPEYWAPQEQTKTATGADTQDAPESLARPFDVRKPLIVVGFVGLFLGAWGLALRSRQQRLLRAAESAVEQERAEAALAQKSH